MALKQYALNHPPGKLVKVAPEIDSATGRPGSACVGYLSLNAKGNATIDSGYVAVSPTEVLLFLKFLPATGDALKRYNGAAFLGCQMKQWSPVLRGEQVVYFDDRTNLVDF